MIALALPRARRSGRSLLEVTTGSVFLLLATAFLGGSEPRLISNIVISDVAIFALIVTWVIHVVQDTSRSQHEAGRLVAPLTLIFGGSLIAATHVGLRGFVIDDLVRDVGVFCSFLAVLDLLRRSRPEVLRWVLGAAMVAVTILTASLLIDNTLRARASFPNPNIPAHLLSCAVLIFAVMTRSKVLRAVMVTVALVGLYRTGSFGATLQLLVAGGYLLITWVCAHTRTRERLRVAFFATLIVVTLATAFGVNSYLNQPAAKQESGLSAARLDRSGSTRFKVWEDAFQNFTAHPLGTGPGSSRGLSLLALATETHNEPLSYLSERGVIAFTGLLLLWVTVWRFTRRGGLARALLCGYLVASCFRETMHYRHWWIFLPLAMVFDEQRATSAAAPPTPGPVTHQPVPVGS
jgi:hypothetical protein